MNTALHYASKILALAWQPLSWVAALMLLGVFLLFLKPQRAVIWGRRFCATAVVLLLFLGWQAPSNHLLRQLEDQYEAPTGDLTKFHGMIVLGGAFGGFDGRPHGQIALGCAGERVSIPVPLMAEYPHFKLHFSGGDGTLIGARGIEADVAETYFERMGVDMKRTSFERQSRNTFENAVNSANALGDDKTKPWLLVTSAAHMPRAMATFEKAGINVTAYPVDYQSIRANAYYSYAIDGGAWDWAVWLRETIGAVIYRALGRA